MNARMKKTTHSAASLRSFTSCDFFSALIFRCAMHNIFSTDNQKANKINEENYPNIWNYRLRISKKQQTKHNQTELLPCKMVYEQHSIKIIKLSIEKTTQISDQI